MNAQHTVAEDGSHVLPFNTTSEAASAVPAGGAMVIAAGEYPEMLTLDQPMTLYANGRTVTIGVP